MCAARQKCICGFINGKLISSAIIGVLCFVLNLILQIPYNILIAVVIGDQCDPLFGPIIGAVPCVMILLIMDPWAALALWSPGHRTAAVRRQYTRTQDTGKQYRLVGNLGIGGHRGGRRTFYGFAGMLLGVPTFCRSMRWSAVDLPSFEGKGIDRGEPFAALNKDKKHHILLCGPLATKHSCLITGQDGTLCS